MLSALALLSAAPAPDAFATRLWRALPTERGNVVVSPVSMKACLGLLIQAAGPSSKAALAQTLGVPTAGLTAYDLMLQKRLRELAGGGETVFTNGAFFAAEPRPAYAAAVGKGYGARVERLRTGAAGVRQVNDWVKARTKERIPRLIDQAPPGILAIFVNATTFDGLWLNSFPARDTKKEAFAAPSGSRQVETMHLAGARLRVGKGEGFRLAVLPYEGGRYEMTILLPDAGDPAHLLKSRGWQAAHSGATERAVDLALPRFTLRSEPGVEGALKAMGFAPLFRKIDLSLALSGEGSSRVSKVVQKTFVEVSEKGTKAAAATAIISTRSMRPPVRATPFQVDRPFAFVIRHVSTGETLFEGVVREP